LKTYELFVYADIPHLTNSFCKNMLKQLLRSLCCELIFLQIFPIIYFYYKNVLKKRVSKIMPVIIHMPIFIHSSFSVLIWLL